jgi:hypothetical protein
MNLWDYLDRAGERRAKRPRRDVRAVVGFAFLAGYYWMVYQFSQRALPTENLDLIRDAMLTLGPPVGIIVGAMFRNDVRDEQAAENTGAAFRAVEAAAAAGSPNALRPDVTLQPGETAQAADRQ